MSELLRDEIALIRRQAFRDAASVIIGEQRRQQRIIADGKQPSTTHQILSRMTTRIGKMK